MYVSEQTFLSFVRKRLISATVLFWTYSGFVYISTPSTFYMGHMSFFDVLFNGTWFYPQPPQLSVHGLWIAISIKICLDSGRFIFQSKTKVFNSSLRFQSMYSGQETLISLRLLSQYVRILEKKKQAYKIQCRSLLDLELLDTEFKLTASALY